MRSPRRALALPLLLLVAPLGACDTEGVDPVPFDPSTVDYDQVSGTDFGDYVQPLLAARNVFAATAGTTPGALASYTWAAIFGSAAGETIVPFDEEGSHLVRFVEDLAADADIPYPNLRRLEADELRFLKRWIAAGSNRSPARNCTRSLTSWRAACRIACSTSMGGGADSGARAVRSFNKTSCTAKRKQAGDCGGR